MIDHATLMPDQSLKTGHIYIVDLKACDRIYEWLLSAILLSSQPWLARDNTTYMTILKIKSPSLHTQVLSIQQALTEGKNIYAEIAFNPLEISQTPNPETIAAELLGFNHLIIKYRN